MTDKEKYVCLSCYFVGEIDTHGRCTKCQGDAVVPQALIEALNQPTSQPEAQPKQPTKPLRWWHFVCGPFETYVSNRRCSNLAEASHEVSHDNYEWTVWNPVILVDNDLSLWRTVVTEIDDKEYRLAFAEGNARKSEYYQMPENVVKGQDCAPTR